MKPLTNHELAAGGNGSPEYWQEHYEPECNRDPREYRGGVDRDPRYDNVNMAKQASCEALFIKRLGDLFDGEDTAERLDA